MAVQTLPAIEDTRARIMAYPETEDVKSILVYNDSGAVISQNDVVIVSGFIGIASEDIGIAGTGVVLISDEVIVSVNDLMTGGDTFATLGQTVYFNYTAGEFTDNGQGLAVGKLTYAKDANGMIKFMKTRRAFPLDDEPIVLKYAVDVDRTTLVEVDFGFNFDIIDVLLLCNATSGGGTILISDSASNAITDAMIAAVVDVPARNILLDGANDYNKITDGIVEFIANGAADRATIYLTVIPTGV